MAEAARLRMRRHKAVCVELLKDSYTATSKTEDNTGYGNYGK